MDSTEVPVYGEQEQSAYNGYFESTCFHPLLQFNGEGDCLAATQVGRNQGEKGSCRRNRSKIRRFLVYLRPEGAGLAPS